MFAFWHFIKRINVKQPDSIPFHKYISHQSHFNISVNEQHLMVVGEQNDSGKVRLKVAQPNLLSLGKYFIFSCFLAVLLKIKT